MTIFLQNKNRKHHLTGKLIVSIATRLLNTYLVLPLSVHHVNYECRLWGR